MASCLDYEIEHRGFKCKAEDLADGSGDAVIEISYGDRIIRKFRYPAYKMFNISAHFPEIVESEINNDQRGYEIAGWDGLGGVIMPVPVNEE